MCCKLFFWLLYFTRVRRFINDLSLVSSTLSHEKDVDGDLIAPSYISASDISVSVLKFPFRNERIKLNSIACGTQRVVLGKIDARGSKAGDRQNTAAASWLVLLVNV